MKQPTRIQDILIVLFLLLLAAALRFYGINWGLPQVYEEATPLKTAWEMWGWGDHKSFDLNPHFFNYPSLFIYIQLLGQGLLFLGMRLFGLVDSTLDYRVLYVLQKTPFFLLGRSITALFGVATVWVTYILGRRISGKTMAITAALFLAINTLHISKSQAVEVDVPMTFFAILALFFIVSSLRSPTKRNYLLAGLTVGLAASTKYTAALLVLPLLAAFILTRRQSSQRDLSDTGLDNRKPPWKFFGLALAAALLVFFVTSPFVLLDSSTFFRHFSLERQHMRLGHFGLDTTPTWLFYAQSLTSRMLGWPLAMFTLFGLIFLAGIKRRPWAIIFAAFLVPYLIAATSWAMKADRYLLPILPVALLFTGGMFAESLRFRKLIRASRNLRLGITVLAMLLLGFPLLAAYPDHLDRLKPDSRTEAKTWIEDNIPSGSFILVEHYGPDLFSPKKLWSLQPDVKERILDRKTPSPLYAVQQLPLLQVKPERSGVFYILSLYDIADVIITSSGVQARYLKEPDRFRPQIAFYDSLEKRFDKVKEFPSRGGTGPMVKIYKNPRQNVPFARRRTVSGPLPVEPSAEPISRAEEFFYENLGLNYETYAYFPEALASYELAFRYPIVEPVAFKGLVLGRARCLVALGRHEEAIEFLKRTEKLAPDQAIRRSFQSMRQHILFLKQSHKE